MKFGGCVGLDAPHGHASGQYDPLGHSGNLTAQLGFPFGQLQSVSRGISAKGQFPPAGWAPVTHDERRMMLGFLLS